VADRLLGYIERLPSGCATIVEGCGVTERQTFSLSSTTGVTFRRAVYLVFVGDIPGGYSVVATCSTVGCVAAEHLEAVSASEVAARSNRARAGLNRKWHESTTTRRPERIKLTELAVAEARLRAAAGETTRSLAAEFGVDAATMSLALRGRTWAHVDVPPLEARTSSRKLSDRQVAEVVERRAAGEALRSLAVEYGVSAGTISSWTKQDGVDVTTT